MTRNPYFSFGTQAEKDLYEDLIIEANQIYGQNVYYLPRTIVNKDPIWYDDIPSRFSNAYIVEMYIETVDGFAGENDLFAKFGVEIRDQATFIVARKRWRETVGNVDNDINSDLPRNGDLIYLPLSKSLFKIMHVERESPFYQLSNLNVVRLECELFEYNDNDFDTGITEIDAIETLGYEMLLGIDSGWDSAIIGDTLTQTFASGVTVTGEITGWDSDNNILSVAHVGSNDGSTNHLFAAGGIITAAQSGTVRTITTVEDDLGDHGYQNKVFDSDVDPYLVFDENNPFGTPE